MSGSMSPNPNGYKLSTLVPDNWINEFWSGAGEGVLHSIKEKITTSRKDVEESLQNRFSENEVEGFSKFKTEEQLRKELVRCTKDAESKQGDYFNRAGRMKRAGRQLTAFFADLHEFYKMFSGLSGLLNVVAPGSSEAANILFAVLIVAVNKKKTVDLMASAVKMLRNQLARIEILDNVYNTDRIRECVAEVYIQGIQFARDAVIYYSQRSILRLWQAINRPQSFLQEKVVELDISITNWKDEMMVLMHKRVSEMSENLSDLHNELVEQRLDRVCDLLHPRPEQHHEKLNFVSERRARLVEVFTLHKYAVFQVERLFDSPQFTSWKSSSASSLLIVQGETLAPADTHYSWLSIAAAQLIHCSEPPLDQYTERRPAPFYFVCQREGYRIEDVDRDLLLSTLIGQMVKSERGRRTIHQGAFEDALRRGLQGQPGEGTLGHLSPARRIERLSHVFIMLIEQLKFERIYLVLDHVDRISGTSAFFDWLAEILKNKACTIKVIVIADSVGREVVRMSDFAEGIVQQITFNQNDFY